MKILQRVGVMNRGGQETLWMNFLRNCDRKDLQIDFLVKTDGGAYDKEISELGSRVIFQGQYRSRGIFQWIERIKLVADTIKNSGDYDVFHINTYLAIDALCDVLSAKLAGIKTIVVHSHNSDGPHRLLQAFLRPVLNHMGIKKAACSDKAAKWMFGTEKNILIINNGIDTQEFQMNQEIRNRIRNELDIKEDEVLIGHVGRFDDQKNHTFLIDIFYELSKINNKVKLLMVGRGTLENSIRKKVDKLGITDRVIFFGVSNKVSELMMAMDIFLFPSLYEGLPLVVVEAQSAGLKCFCSDTISKDAIITDYVISIPLSEDAYRWSSIIEEGVDYLRIDTNNIVAQKGFDISQSIQQVKKLYLS